MNDRQPPIKFIKFEIIAAAGLSSGKNHSAVRWDVEFTKKVWPTAQRPCPATNQRKGADVAGAPTVGALLVSTWPMTVGPHRNPHPVARQSVARTKNLWQPSSVSNLLVKNTPGT